MDDMLKMYIEKRREYESKIKKDLLDIEKSVTGFVEVDDYFSIKDKEELITFKIIEINTFFFMCCPLYLIYSYFTIMLFKLQGIH